MYENAWYIVMHDNIVMHQNAWYLVMHQNVSYIATQTVAYANASWLQRDYDILSLKPCANLDATPIDTLTDPNLEVFYSQNSKPKHG